MKETKKLSYEELEKVAANLQGRCVELTKALQNANIQNLFIRIDYLFKVIGNKDSFSTAFVEKCAKEIETLLTDEEAQ